MWTQLFKLVEMHLLMTSLRTSPIVFSTYFATLAEISASGSATSTGANSSHSHSFSPPWPQFVRQEWDSPQRLNPSSSQDSSCTLLNLDVFKLPQTEYSLSTRVVDSAAESYLWQPSVTVSVLVERVMTGITVSWVVT